MSPLDFPKLYNLLPLKKLQIFYFSKYFYNYDANNFRWYFLEFNFEHGAN